MTTNPDLTTLIRRLYEISSPEGVSLLNKIIQNIDLQLAVIHHGILNALDPQDKGVPSLLDEGEKHE